MRKLRAWFLRLLGVSNRGPYDSEFSEEIETHLQMHIQDNLRSGMTAEEARRKAISKLGGVEMTKQEYREQHTLPFIETVLWDLRFAMRQLKKNPGFAGTAMLVLALGIGASVAIFAFVDAALIKPLPYENPSHLLFVTETTPEIPRAAISYAD